VSVYIAVGDDTKWLVHVISSARSRRTCTGTRAAPNDSACGIAMETMYAIPAGAPGSIGSAAHDASSSRLCVQVASSAHGAATAAALDGVKAASTCVGTKDDATSEIECRSAECGADASIRRASAWIPASILRRA
jgi:hypothetical protein